MGENTVKNRGSSAIPNDLTDALGVPRTGERGIEGGHTDDGSDRVYAPVLSPAQIERVQSFARLKQVQAGQVLYEPGEDTPRCMSFFQGGSGYSLARETENKS